MIIRVKICINTANSDDCEKITFNSCKIYTDEQEALKGTDEELNHYNLNDGCSLGSEEDFLALNAMLAERFNDPYNVSAYAEWEDITERVRDKIYDDFYDFDWPTELLLKMAEECGFSFSDL